MTVVQYLTSGFYPADLPVLVTVVPFLNGVFLSCRSLWFGDCGSVSDWHFFCPADLPVLVTVVQNLVFYCPADLHVLVTGSVSDWCFCPADLPGLLTVVQNLVFYCPADLRVLVTGSVSDRCFCPAGDLTAAPDGADGESGGATAPP